MEKQINEKWVPAHIKDVKKNDKLKVNRAWGTELLTAKSDCYMNKERLTYEVIAFQEREGERWVLEGPVAEAVLQKLKMMEMMKKRGLK
jgi:hypothetical protein